MKKRKFKDKKLKIKYHNRKLENAIKNLQDKAKKTVQDIVMKDEQHEIKASTPLSVE